MSIQTPAQIREARRRRGLALGGRRTGAPKNRTYHWTPEAVVGALIDAEGSAMPRRLWDPTSGTGECTLTLRREGFDVLATDLVDYDVPSLDIFGVDLCDPQVGNYVLKEARGIVMHPPATPDAALMIENAIEHSWGMPVYVYTKLMFIESVKRRPLMARLRKMYAFDSRPPGMIKSATRSAPTPMAWLVFNIHHKGPAILEMIRWQAAEARLSARRKARGV